MEPPPGGDAEQDRAEAMQMIQAIPREKLEKALQAALNATKQRIELIKERDAVIAALQNRVEALENQLKEKQSLLASREEEIREEKDAFRHQLDTATSALQNEVASLKAELGQKVEELRNMQNMRHAVEEQKELNTALRLQLSSLAEENDKQKKQLQQRLEELKHSNGEGQKKLQRDLQHLTSALADKEAENTQVRSELEVLTTTLNRYEDVITKMQADKLESKEKHTAALHQSRLRISELEAENTSLRESYEAQVNDLKEKLVQYGQAHLVQINDPEVPSVVPQPNSSENNVEHGAAEMKDREINMLKERLSLLEKENEEHKEQLATLVVEHLPLTKTSVFSLTLNQSEFPGAVTRSESPMVSKNATYAAFIHPAAVESSAQASKSLNGGSEALLNEDFAVSSGNDPQTAADGIAGQTVIYGDSQGDGIEPASSEIETLLAERTARLHELENQITELRGALRKYASFGNALMGTEEIQESSAIRQREAGDNVKIADSCDQEKCDPTQDLFVSGEVPTGVINEFEATTARYRRKDRWSRAYSWPRFDTPLPFSHEPVIQPASGGPSLNDKPIVPSKYDGQIEVAVVTTVPSQSHVLIPPFHDASNALLNDRNKVDSTVWREFQDFVSRLWLSKHHVTSAKVVPLACRKHGELSEELDEPTGDHFLAELGEVLPYLIQLTESDATRKPYHLTRSTTVCSKLPISEGTQICVQATEDHGGPPGTTAATFAENRLMAPRFISHTAAASPPPPPPPTDDLDDRNVVSRSRKENHLQPLDSIHIAGQLFLEFLPVMYQLGSGFIAAEDASGIAAALENVEMVLTSVVERLEKQHRDIVESGVRQLFQHSKQLAEERLRARSLTAKLTDEAAIAKHKEEMAMTRQKELKAELAEAKDGHNKLQTQVTRIRGSIAAAKAQLAEACDRELSMKRTIETLTAEKQKLAAEKEEYELKVSELQRTIALRLTPPTAAALKLLNLKAEPVLKVAVPGTTQRWCCLLTSGLSTAGGLTNGKNSQEHDRAVSWWNDADLDPELQTLKTETLQDLHMKELDGLRDMCRSAELKVIRLETKLREVVNERVAYQQRTEEVLKSLNNENIVEKKLARNTESVGQDGDEKGDEGGVEDGVEDGGENRNAGDDNESRGEPGGENGSVLIVCTENDGKIRAHSSAAATSANDYGLLQKSAPSQSFARVRGKSVDCTTRNRRACNGAADDVANGYNALKLAFMTAKRELAEERLLNKESAKQIKQLRADLMVKSKVLEEELRDAQTLNTELKTKLEAREAEVIETRCRIEDLQQQLLSAQTRLRRLGTELAEQRERVMELTQKQRVLTFHMSERPKADVDASNEFSSDKKQQRLLSESTANTDLLARDDRRHNSVRLKALHLQRQQVITLILNPEGTESIIGTPQSTDGIVIPDSTTGDSTSDSRFSQNNADTLMNAAGNNLVLVPKVLRQRIRTMERALQDEKTQSQLLLEQNDLLKRELRRTETLLRTEALLVRNDTSSLTRPGSATPASDSSTRSTLVTPQRAPTEYIRNTVIKFMETDRSIGAEEHEALFDVMAILFDLSREEQKNIKAKREMALKSRWRLF